MSPRMLHVRGQVLDGEDKNESEERTCCYRVVIGRRTRAVEAPPIIIMISLPPHGEHACTACPAWLPPQAVVVLAQH
jgi:hypothetical protein